MRVLGLYYEDYLALEVYKAEVIGSSGYTRVEILSGIDEYYILHKDGSPLTAEEANSLVREMASRDMMDLDQYDMKLYFGESRISIPVINTLDDYENEYIPLIIEQKRGDSPAKKDDEEGDDEAKGESDDGDDAAKRPDLSEEDLSLAAERLGIKGHIFRGKDGKPDVFFSPEERQMIIKEALKERGYVSEEELAKKYGVSAEELRKICEEAGITPMQIEY